MFHLACISSAFFSSTVFRQINTPCALTDTLMNSGGPGEYSRVFSAIFAHFDQFSPILRGVFHQKVLWVRLFKQACLFGKIWYMVNPHGSQGAAFF